MPTTPSLAVQRAARAAVSARAPTVNRTMPGLVGASSISATPRAFVVADVCWPAPRARTTVPTSGRPNTFRTPTRTGTVVPARATRRFTEMRSQRCWSGGTKDETMRMSADATLFSGTESGWSPRTPTVLRRAPALSIRVRATMRTEPPGGMVPRAHVVLPQVPWETVSETNMAAAAA